MTTLRQENPGHTQRKKIVRETPLTSLVSVGVLQRVQDWFADTSGISVVVRDLSGRPVTKPSYQNPFCKRIMETEFGEAACCTSYLKTLKRVERTRRVVKYSSRARMLQFSAPIIVEGECVGCIVMGGRPERPLSARQIAALARATGVPKEEISSALGRVAEWTEEEIARSVTFLESVANTMGWLCVQGAVLRGKLRELESLFEVSRLLASTLDLRKVLKLVARSAVEVVAAKGCSVRLLGPRSKRLEIKSYYNLSRRYLDKGAVVLEDSLIDKTALKGEVVQIPDMLNDPRVLYPREAEREGIRSGVSLGLISKRRPVGTLHVYRAEQDSFNEGEIQVLTTLANQAAVAIENAQLYQQTLEKRRIERELRVAGEIQSQLLPERPPEIAGFDIASINIPCRAVGGDFYDFVPLRGGKTAVIIADVAGKGVPGALLMASARSAGRAYLERTSRPHEAVSRLNLFVCHDTRTGQFVSLFCGVLDHKKRTFAYTNAGHNPPLLLRKGETISLEKGGLVLGADEGEQYEEETVTLHKGDLLAFYTDGVTEALNEKGQFFGADRMLKALRRKPHTSASAIVNRTCSAVKRFTRGAEQSDDITMIVVRVV